MLGPIAAWMSVAPAARSFSTPFFSASAARPRQPAWIIATPSGAISATGRQSAVTTTAA